MVPLRTAGSRDAGFSMLLDFRLSKRLTSTTTNRLSEGQRPTIDYDTQSLVEVTCSRISIAHYPIKSESILDFYALK